MTVGINLRYISFYSKSMDAISVRAGNTPSYYVIYQVADFEGSFLWIPVIECRSKNRVFWCLWISVIQKPHAKFWDWQKGPREEKNSCTTCFGIIRGEFYILIKATFSFSSEAWNGEFIWPFFTGKGHFQLFLSPSKIAEWVSQSRTGHYAVIPSLRRRGGRRPHWGGHLLQGTFILQDIRGQHTRLPTAAGQTESRVGDLSFVMVELVKENIVGLGKNSLSAWKHKTSSLRLGLPGWWPGLLCVV